MQTIIREPETDAVLTPDDASHATETPGVAGHMRASVLAMLVFTVALGLLAPLVMTGIAQVAFPKQANGSLIPGPDGQPVGSELIGQAVDPRLQPFYFASRPSALSSNGTPAPYDASNSGGSNLAQTSQKQHDAVATNVAAARAAYGTNDPVPADLGDGFRQRSRSAYHAGSGAGAGRSNRRRTGRWWGSALRQRMCSGS